ncbi:MAG: stage V sporulation protein AB [Roseburia sp.]
MWIKHVLLGICGLTAGAAAAAGTVAFLIMLKILPRIMGKSHTTANFMLYENIVALGIVLGNIVSVFLQIQLPLGHVFLAIYGICAGIFVGCIAMALAEVLRAFPIMFRRLKINEGLDLLMVSIALGKAAGSLYFFFHNMGAS